MEMTEFRVFEGSEAAAIDPQGVKWPEGTAVLYAIEGDKVVGRAALLPLPHVEGVWVDDSKRGSSLALRLVTHLEELVRADGKSHIFAFAWDGQPKVAEYLERREYQLAPLKVYMKKVTKD